MDLGENFCEEKLVKFTHVKKFANRRDIMTSNRSNPSITKRKKSWKQDHGAAGATSQEAEDGEPLSEKEDGESRRAGATSQEAEDGEPLSGAEDGESRHRRHRPAGANSRRIRVNAWGREDGGNIGRRGQTYEESESMPGAGKMVAT